jgi:hypothetical protein
MSAKLTARSQAHRRRGLTGTTAVMIAGLLLAGCASQSPQEQRVATGATLGGATGALIGRLAGGSAGSAVAGGLAGAAVGAIASSAPPPAPVVYAGPPCYWTRGAPVWDDYRGVWIRPRVRVCD